MFLNDLSIYSIPLIGIVVLVLALRSSRSVSSLKQQLSSKSRSQRHVSDDDDCTLNPHVSIDISPLAKSNHIEHYRSRMVTLSPLDDDDDDEELIGADISSIRASNFGENNSIELRVNQDVDYDNDLVDGDR